MGHDREERLQAEEMNTPIVQPYLMFAGRCEEALEFYKSTLGAEEVMLMRFRDAPEKPPEGQLAEGWEDKVMHCGFRVGESLIMASDGCNSNNAGFSGFSLSVTMPDEAAARKAFGALSEGGEITMPIDGTFWSPCFGMVTDKFGVGWMVTVPEVKA